MVVAKGEGWSGILGLVDVKFLYTEWINKVLLVYHKELYSISYNKQK